MLILNDKYEILKKNDINIFFCYYNYRQLKQCEGQAEMVNVPHIVNDTKDPVIFYELEVLLARIL
jgi:hypothetical protein